jgi:uncharacterized cupin superfamily protein
VIPEAPLDETDAGLVPRGAGWFVLNARDARWIRKPGRGQVAPLTGWTDAEAERLFPQLGVNLIVLGPGEPIGMYHWEADQEDFLLLSGDAVLLVEGEERPLRALDFVHCPPETRHMIVAGDHGCALVAVGSREHQAGAWGAYTVDELALHRGAGVDVETDDATVAYARFPKPQAVSYPDGLLPDELG